MIWTAILPVNHGGDCKTRLSDCLSPAERRDLVAAMARHVLGVLRASPDIASVAVLAPERPPFAPDGWIADGGRGLNAELAAARARFPGAAMLILHADLPLLGAADIAALLTGAAANGAAIAPDWAGTGTNAIAIADGRPFAPAFGAGSFASHRAAMPDAAIIRTAGLGFDVDEPDSLRHAVALGLAGPFASLPSPRRYDARFDGRVD